jgi:flap endonuclease-1
MGIPTLNSFLQQKCTKAITRIHLQKLEGKKIAIDTSIYLYKFESSGSLIEQFYLFLILLNKYKITPLFIFDGKTPQIKQETILKRRKEKVAAVESYNKLKEFIEIEGSTPELVSKLSTFKKKSVVMNMSKINKVKLLLTYYGACFLEAEGEADLLCVELVKSQIVYACLSEDMDMFAYGCPRILRYISLINHNIVFYNTSYILSILKIDQTDLQNLCILSGTDYNINSINKEKNFEYWYNKLMDYKAKWRKQCFIDWVTENDADIEKEKITEISNIFTSKLNITDLQPNEIVTGITMTKELNAMLEEDGFIFE